eukprot:CAMPEP_0197266762 /NCGR_PEP_ID=MMETSP1432-20130617/3192_1 /TAXON_ID=44447 /ORGANISM="Pseudo-nitzschia delicatissima, Strain UNC1205" /LENGTH=325 /DNA_ID=CAMNT_0042731655 /DNA_START=155 /DNA_END=1132 /DNA_ORIENTATION=+
MSTNAASRCCAQLGLVRRFSSALSLSSPLTSSSSYGKAAPKAFSTVACGSNALTSASSTALSPQSIPASSNNLILSTVSSSNNNTSCVIRRTMGTSNRKVIDAKNAKRLKIQQKKKKNTNVKKVASEDVEGVSDETKDSNNPFLQHEEWVRFQQSITVDGFQTGQTTTATVLKKSRGGKQARRKREKELARLGAFAETAGPSEKISAVAQKFPAIRYSPEETEDLLQQAYAVLPARDGKRGTRNLRRQETRWKRVRKIRSDYKAHMINAHSNRMEARKYKRDRTKDALESASEQRQSDLDYQGMVLKRWMETMEGKSASKSDDTA